LKNLTVNQTNQPKGNMNHRRQLKTPAIKTHAQMETLVREIAGLKLDEKLLLAGMDRELQAARDRYESRLLALERLLAEKTGLARAWARANPAAFGRRRSVDFGHGIAGFRTGPPRLATIVKCKWDRVLRSLRGLDWGAAYIRVKEEINKEQIIADVGAGKLAEADLRQAGARVVREESFYIEPKLARVEPREVAEAA
jgi:phage host-nuclease inhibitor protein Gam